jgi:hypothetical protein
MLICLCMIRWYDIAKNNNFQQTQEHFPAKSPGIYRAYSLGEREWAFHIRGACNPIKGLKPHKGLRSVMDASMARRVEGSTHRLPSCCDQAWRHWHAMNPSARGSAHCNSPPLIRCYHGCYLSFTSYGISVIHLFEEIMRQLNECGKVVWIVDYQLI